MFLYVYFPFYTRSTFEHINEQTLKKIHQSSYTQRTNIYVLVLLLNGFSVMLFHVFLYFFFFLNVTVCTYLRKYWFFIHTTSPKRKKKEHLKSAYIRMLVASLILLLHFQLFASFMAIRLHSYDSISIHSDAKDER